MEKIARLAAITIIGLFMLAGSVFGVRAANPETAPVLNNLFAELKIAKNREAALDIEQRIWAAWYKSGDANIDLLMQQARLALREGQMKEALEVADEVVKRAPDYSEGWNFRATALYIANRLDASMRDVVKVLALEPRHFGALAGSALILLRKGKKGSALKAINLALDIHPYLRGAAEIIREAGGAEKKDPI